MVISKTAVSNAMGSKGTILWTLYKEVSAISLRFLLLLICLTSRFNLTIPFMLTVLSSTLTQSLSHLYILCLNINLTEIKPKHTTIMWSLNHTDYSNPHFPSVVLSSHHILYIMHCPDVTLTIILTKQRNQTQMSMQKFKINLPFTSLSKLIIRRTSIYLTLSCAKTSFPFRVKFIPQKYFTENVILKSEGISKIYNPVVTWLNHSLNLQQNV